MSIEHNTSLVQRFFGEVFNRLDRTTAGQILTPDYVAHHPNFGEIHGPDGTIGMAAGMRAAFPDLSYAIEDVVATEEKVAVRWTARGTHAGEFQGIPPTQRAVSITGIDIFRVADGKLAETWINSDILGLMQQLGIIPGPDGVGV